MVGVRGCLELLHLFAANAVLLADALDPVNTDLDAVISKVAL
jgi:hypothetical protein